MHYIKESGIEIVKPPTNVKKHKAKFWKQKALHASILLKIQEEHESEFQ